MINRKRNTNQKRAILIGSSSYLNEVVLAIKKNDLYDIKVSSIIEGTEGATQRKFFSMTPVYHSIDILSDLIFKTNSTEIILAFEEYIAPDLIKRIVELCMEVRVNIRNAVFSEGKLKLHSLNPEDLFCSKPIDLDHYSIENMIKNKVVLVTGAGGSIGSELCKQIASYQPRKLIFYEITELFLYHLVSDFQSEYPGIKFQSILGDVQNKEQLEWVMANMKPNIVFHAAAYKHVPMMEENPISAIHTNIRGTWYIANLALKYDIDKFVFISTDKAVNPANVMGVSKRICELICRHMQTKSLKSKFIAVRFGNVLGSAGSVVERFKKQILQGGPITVTHPEIKRYFMSITEASQLVMQAGAIGNGGEIFVLDMKEPVKILDLAKKMVFLAGQVPEKDIEIVFTGLRPGEKLYEELLTDAEATMATTSPGVRIARMTSYPRDLSKELDKIFQLPYNTDFEKVIECLKKLVPEMQIKKKQPTANLKILKSRSIIG